MPLPAVIPAALWIASIIAGEETVRRGIKNTKPSILDLAETTLNADDHHRFMQTLRDENEKTRTVGLLSHASEGIDRVEEKQQRVTEFSENFFLQQHKDDLAQLAIRTPPSALEVYASVERMMRRG